MKEHNVRQKDQNQEISRLMSEYRAKGISRREFMKRALVLGLSAPTAASLLANAAPALARSAASQQPAQGGTFIEGHDRDIQPVEPISPRWGDPSLDPVYAFRPH